MIMDIQKSFTESKILKVAIVDDDLSDLITMDSGLMEQTRQRLGRLSFQ